jgi:pilus assembly protein TadC
MNIAIGIVIVAISILVGFLVYFKASDNSLNRVHEARKELYENNSKFNKFIRLKPKTYNKLQIYLSRIGVNYILKRVVDPIEYELVNAALAVIFGTLGYCFFGLIGLLIGCILGFYLLRVLLDINNSKDNDKIVEDLQSIYENIKINIESGVFLTEALNSCYKVASCDRLKKALYEMITDIMVKQNVMDAIEDFKLKFKSVHIDTFCTVLRQGYETGDTMAALSSVSQQLISIQKAVEIKHKQQLENDIMKVMLIILIAIIVVIMYAVVIEYSIAMVSY